jgi:hypothetical protein
MDDMMKAHVRLISGLRKLFSSIHFTRQRPIVGWVFFIVGLLSGFAFNSLAVIADLNGSGYWGDYRDAVQFNHDQFTRADLVGIRCPILLAPGEAGTITAAFHNPNPQKADILVKAVASVQDNVHYQPVPGSLSIGPGEKIYFSWRITPQNVIEKNYILTRVFLMSDDPYNPVPARTDSCGVFVLSFLSLKGASLVVLMVAVSLICLAVGSVLLNLSDSPLYNTSPRIDVGLYILTGIIVVDMIANLLGWWIFAGLLLILAVLLTSILILNMFGQSG